MTARLVFAAAPGRARAGAMVLVLGLLIGACSSDPPELAGPCPSASLLQGAESASIYVPGSDRRPEDLELAIALNDLVSACQFTGAGVDVALAFNLLAQRGPAYRPEPARLSYFVATVGPDRRILDKELFDAEITVPAGQEAIGMRETLTLRLPGLGEDEAARYRVYVGLQLEDAARRERLEPEAGPL
jgi:hypothetical protein